jgi:hypothetical protein
VDLQADDAESSGLLFLTALSGKPLGRAKTAPMRHAMANGLNTGQVLIVPHATLCTEFARPGYLPAAQMIWLGLLFLRSRQDTVAAGMVRRLSLCCTTWLQ